MSAYRRFVTYLFQYKNGRKEGSCGFAKLEARQGRCRMELQIKGCMDGNYVLYLFHAAKRGPVGVKIGEIRVRSGNGREIFIFAEDAVGESPYTLNDMNGIRLNAEGEGFIASQWDDAEVDFGEFRVYGAGEAGRNAEEYAENRESDREEYAENRESDREEYAEEGESDREEYAENHEPEREEYAENRESERKEYAENREPEREEYAENREPEREEYAENRGSERKKNAENREPEREKSAENQRRGNDERICSEAHENRANLKQEPGTGNVSSVDGAAAEMKATQADTCAMSGNSYSNPTASGQGDRLHAADADISSYMSAWEKQWQRFRLSHPVLCPFEDTLKVYAIKMDLRDLRFLPKKYHSLSNNSFLLHGYFNYRYLLFGHMDAEEEIRWFLAVPGVYQDQEQLLAGIFGFPEFRAKKATQQKIGAFGFWVRYLDL